MIEIWKTLGKLKDFEGFLLCTAPCRGSMPQKRRMGRVASKEDGSSLLDF